MQLIDDAGVIVNKVFGGIHKRFSNAFYKTDTVVEMPSTDDLATTVTQTKHLWDDYCTDLRNNGIVTNLACKEYLFIFIGKNQKRIAEQHFILESGQNEDLRYSRGNPKDDNSQSYLTSFAKYMLPPQGESNLLRKMFQGCKDEIIYATEKSNANLKDSASKPVLDQTKCRTNNKETGRSKTYRTDLTKKRQSESSSFLLHLSTPRSCQPMPKVPLSCSETKGDVQTEFVCLPAKCNAKKCRNYSFTSIVA